MPSPAAPLCAATAGDHGDASMALGDQVLRHCDDGRAAVDEYVVDGEWRGPHLASWPIRSARLGSGVEQRHEILNAYGEKGSNGAVDAALTCPVEKVPLGCRQAIRVDGDDIIVALLGNLLDAADQAGLEGIGDVGHYAGDRHRPPCLSRLCEAVRHIAEFLGDGRHGCAGRSRPRATECSLRPAPSTRSPATRRHESRHPSGLVGPTSKLHRYTYNLYV